MTNTPPMPTLVIAQPREGWGESVLASVRVVIGGVVARYPKSVRYTGSI